MPYKPKKPCAFPGCAKLTHSRYCDEHVKATANDYNQHHRDPAAKKRYGYSWKKIRDKYIKVNPLCEICRAYGRFIPADTVHHKQPLADGGTHEWKNLQSLCKGCHSRIHMAENNQK